VSFGLLGSAPKKSTGGLAAAREIQIEKIMLVPACLAELAHLPLALRRHRLVQRAQLGQLARVWPSCILRLLSMWRPRAAPPAPRTRGYTAKDHPSKETRLPGCRGMPGRGGPVPRATQQSYTTPDCDCGHVANEWLRYYRHQKPKPRGKQHYTPLHMAATQFVRNGGEIRMTPSPRTNSMSN
jgi:hypothetical protein